MTHKCTLYKLVKKYWVKDCGRLLIKQRILNFSKVSVLLLQQCISTLKNISICICKLVVAFNYNI